ncbi:MAG: DUF1700 domain-containing protein [Oligoflexia bacterium]|nr:DUF1700 domain-containing protein [Oligoflexia bacterium]
MSTPAKLESYLAKLDKALGPIAISEKADIVTEIRSHVLEAQKHDEGQSLESILDSLGEPEQVANRYLLDRGLKPQKAPKHPIVKWLTIGFLGTLSIITIFILIILWKFTPLVKVDETSGRTIILGGLIDVNEKSGSFKNSDSDSDNDQVSGSIDIDLKKTPTIEVIFQNGSMELENSNNSQLQWKCKGANSNGLFEKENARVRLNFKNSSEPKCSLSIPTNVTLVLNGDNGHIDFKKPRYHVSLKLINGTIGISEDPTAKYSYDLHVTSGKTDNFTSTTTNDSYKIEMQLVNGNIEKN